MNTQLNTPLLNGESPEKTFEYYYSEVMGHYELYKKFLTMDEQFKKNPEAIPISEKKRKSKSKLIGWNVDGIQYYYELSSVVYRTSCIDKLKKCIDLRNTSSNRHEMLNAMLLLVRLLQQSVSENDYRDSYFYLAVEWL